MNNESVLVLQEVCSSINHLACVVSVGFMSVVFGLILIYRAMGRKNNE